MIPKGKHFMNSRERVSVVVNPGDLAEKVRSYREFKKVIKEKRRGTKNDDNLSPEEKEARSIVLDIYTRHVNQQIANFYEYGRIIARKPGKTEADLRVLELFGPGINISEIKRFGERFASRTMLRIDRFL